MNLPYYIEVLKNIGERLKVYRITYPQDEDVRASVNYYTDVLRRIDKSIRAINELTMAIQKNNFDNLERSVTTDKMLKESFYLEEGRKLEEYKNHDSLYNYKTKTVINLPAVLQNLENNMSILESIIYTKYNSTLPPQPKIELLQPNQFKTKPPDPTTTVLRLPSRNLIFKPNSKSTGLSTNAFTNVSTNAFTNDTKTVKAEFPINEPKFETKDNLDGSIIPPVINPINILPNIKREDEFQINDDYIDDQIQDIQDITLDQIDQNQSIDQCQNELTETSKNYMRLQEEFKILASNRDQINTRMSELSVKNTQLEATVENLTLQLNVLQAEIDQKNKNLEEVLIQLRNCELKLQTSQRPRVARRRPISTNDDTQQRPKRLRENDLVNQILPSPSTSQQSQVIEYPQPTVSERLESKEPRLNIVEEILPPLTESQINLQPLPDDDEEMNNNHFLTMMKI